MSVDNLQAVYWLLSDAARPWLARAADGALSVVQRAASLRKNLSPEQTRLVLQTIDLRGRARAKFTRAEQMFFTPLGLEQATDEIVARYKAARFPVGVLAADFCCGVGGDFLAIAARGPTLAVDRDPQAAAIAAANRSTVAENYPSLVLAADVATIATEACAAWHIDPDRRPGGQRTTRAEFHEPAPSTIERLWRGCPHSAIKLAPAAVLPEGWAERFELEWISRGRECRQLVVWTGDLARRPGQRGATILGDGTASPRTVTGSDDLPEPEIGPIGRFIFEPDSAVLAAKLAPALAAEHGLSAIAPGVAYLTGDHWIGDAALAAFEVAEVLPFDLRMLTAALRARDIGQLEIKKRGVQLEPAALRAKLKLRGAQRAVVLILPRGGKAIAVLARRGESAPIASDR